jgi:hypothetical protein
MLLMGFRFFAGPIGKVEMLKQYFTFLCRALIKARSGSPLKRAEKRGPG